MPEFVWPIAFSVVFAVIALGGAWFARRVPHDDGVENERDDGGGTMGAIGSLLD